MTSHRLPGWGERPEYPREAQERDYRERGEQAKVLAIAADYKPALIFNTAPGAIDGTPVISPSGLVLGGNGRTLATQLVYSGEGGPSAEHLRAWVADHAKQFGFSRSDVLGFRAPLVVRAIAVDEDSPRALAEWSRRLNSPLTTDLDATKRAVSLARFVPPSLFDSLRALDPEEPLSKFFDSARSAPLVDDLRRAGAITARQAPLLLRGDGLLSDEGRAFVSDLLVAVLLPDAGLIQSLGAGTTATIARAAPWFALTRTLGEYDLAPALGRAARDLVSARVARLSPAEYLRQGGLFGLEPQATDPLGRLLLLALGQWSASPAKLTRAARRYYELAKAPSEGQGALFASEALTPVSALERALSSEGLRA